MCKRRAKVIYICIFRNSLLNTGTSINDFFVPEWLFVRLKSLWLRACCLVLAYTQPVKEQSNPKQTIFSQVVTNVAISDNEVKNIKFDDWVRFTELQRK